MSGFQQFIIIYPSCFLCAGVYKVIKSPLNSTGVERSGP